MVFTSLRVYFVWPQKYEPEADDIFAIVKVFVDDTFAAVDGVADSALVTPMIIPSAIMITAANHMGRDRLGFASGWDW